MKRMYCLFLFIFSFSCHAQSITLVDKINQTEDFITEAMEKNTDYYLQRIEDHPSSFYNSIPFYTEFRILHYSNINNTNAVSFTINITKDKCISIVATENMDVLPKLLKIFSDTSNYNEYGRMEYENTDGEFKIRLEPASSTVTIYIDILKEY